MKTLRNCIFSAVLAFTVLAASIQQSQAVLPVLVYAVARQAVVMTAESITIGVISKGFAANDPYVRTTATLPRSSFARGLSQLRGRWLGLGTLLAAVASLGWMYEDDIGFYIPKGAPFKGYCNSHPSVIDYDACVLASFGAALAYEVSPLQTDYYGGKFVYLCPNGVASGGRSCNGGFGTVFVVTGLGETVKLPVTEAQFNDQALPLIAASPNTLGDMLAGLSQSQLADLLDGATIPYNPTNPSPEVEQLKTDYRNGLLQTVDPSAPHYVTLEQLKQIQDLVAAEDAANTDDGKVEALNKEIKQPITQAQYEETNKKYADSIDAVTAALGASGESDYSDMDDHFKQLDGIITDLPNTSLPAPADISVPQYVDCQQLTLSDGNGHELVFPSPAQCAKIETFKQGFGYFLAVSVVFLLGMQLLTRPHG